jgi:hypothetical protein
MKQMVMFAEAQAKEQKYSTKIEAPVYEPRGERPHLMTLCDDGKTKSLIREINASSLEEEEKRFLIMAAQRHTVFNYERIANYYAHGSADMQRLMEKSALVIIDFNQAIANGYVKLCEEIRGQFLEEYSDEFTTE